MNRIITVRVAAALLTIAALGGIVMAITRFLRNKNPPNWLAIVAWLSRGGSSYAVILCDIYRGIAPAHQCWPRNARARRVGRGRPESEISMENHIVTARLSGRACGPCRGRLFARTAYGLER